MLLLYMMWRAKLMYNACNVVLMRVTTAAERVSSLGKDWHKLCLKCAKCGKSLSAGGHAEVWEWVGRC